MANKKISELLEISQLSESQKIIIPLVVDGTTRQIDSEPFTQFINRDNPTTGSNTFIGNQIITGSITVTSDSRFTNNLVVGGRITAQEFYSEYVSSSVIYESGSTKFGDTLDDIHQWTGSLRITGSLTTNGVDIYRGVVSLNSITSSLFLATQSLYVFTQSANIRLGSIEAYTASLKSAISVSGNTLSAYNVGVSGSLTITGSTNISGSLTTVGDMYPNGIRVGRGAGDSVANTVLGYNAGNSNTTGTGNIFIGNGANTSNGASSNQIVIGSGSVGLGPNSTVIGNALTTQTYIPGTLLLGSPTISPQYARQLQVVGAVNATSILIDSASNSNITYPLSLQTNISTPAAYIENLSTNGFGLILKSAANNGNYIFDARGNGDTSRLTVLSNGRVLIGAQDNAAYRLIVTGSVYADSFVKSGGTSTGFLKADGSVDTTTYATTGSNTFRGTETISGSLIVTGSTNLIGNTTITGSLTITDKIVAKDLYITALTASALYQSGNTKFGDSIDDTHTFTGSIYINGSITGPSSVSLNTSTAVTSAPGVISWNSTDGTLDIGMGYSGATLQVGQEQYYPPVVNKSGNDMTDGTLVMVIPTAPVQGNRLAVQPMIGDGTYPAEYIVGVLTADIPNNQTGLATWFGYVRNINATHLIPVGENWVEGDILYPHPTQPGKLTKNTPVAPALKSTIATVNYINGNNVTLMVRPHLMGTIESLDNISANSATYGDFLIKSGSVWTNTKELSGSYGVTGSLNVTGGITGSTNFNTLVNKPTLVSSSAQITISSTTGYTTFSSSLQTTDNALSSRISTIESKYATTGSNTFTGNQIVNGTINATSFTGSLFGTASYASSALTASYAINALNAQTAFVQGGNSFGTATTIGTNDNNPLLIETNNITRLYISSSGFIGIGTTTPITALDVTGGLRVTGAITGSTNFDTILNKPTLVSSSAQITISNTTGYATFSSSLQTTDNALSTRISAIESGVVIAAAGFATTASNTFNGNQTVNGWISASNGITGSLLGNATTATTLQTSRTINGVSFNGGSNININTLRGNNNQTSAIVTAVDAPPGNFTGGIQLVAGTGGMSPKITTTAGGLILSTVSGYIHNDAKVSFGISSGDTFEERVCINGDVSISNVSKLSSANNTFNSGIQTISSFATESTNYISGINTPIYTSVFYNYTIISGSNTRAGQFITVWNGNQIQYTDVSTLDIGNTSGVIFTASLSSGNVLLTTVLPTNTWTIKTMANLL